MKTLGKPFAIHEDLLEYLRTIFPNTLPLDRGVTPETIAFLQGQQHVLRTLEGLNDEE